MGCDSGTHDTLVDICLPWETKMLSRSYITEEVGSCPGRQGTPYGRSDVVVSGSYVGDQGPEDIERRTVAELLLEEDVGLPGSVPCP
jgi:hypothetical protein